MYLSICHFTIATEIRFVDMDRNKFEEKKKFSISKLEKKDFFINLKN